MTNFIQSPLLKLSIRPFPLKDRSVFLHKQHLKDDFFRSSSSLKEGVFRLKEKHGQKEPSQYETVMILYAGTGLYRGPHPQHQ